MPDTILAVDDNPQNLKLVRLLLAAEGHHVVTAAGADEALRVLETTTPAVILMDLQMPGIDGLELTRRLKADPARSEIVVIALTAYAMRGDRERALAAGCDDYVTKPIDTTALVSLVTRWLERA
ncbi:MAG: response regulator [Acidobacteria bacterium]|nr:response regulator [Acidobacteriota bacterium]